MARLAKSTPARPRLKTLALDYLPHFTPELVGQTLDIRVTTANDETGADIYYTMRLGTTDMGKLVRTIAKHFPEIYQEGLNNAG